MERGFLEHLVEQGLCTPEKLDALLHLPGQTLEPRPAANLRVGLARRVHHVKIAFDGERPVQAKAYYWRSLIFQPLEPAGDARGERAEPTDEGAG